MPQNNPGSQGLGGGETVFIDASSLNEIPHHLMHQDIEALVGLNIPTSELDELQDVPHSHGVDNAAVLMSDPIGVGNMIEVSNKDSDSQESLESSTQPMEVDCLSEPTHVLGDIDLLNQPSELMSFNNQEELIDADVHSSDESHLHDSSMEMPTSTALKSGSNAALKQESFHQNSAPTQILKTSSGHFVILQPNQGGLPIGGLAPGRIFSSNQISSASNSTNFSTKSVFVNANQLNSGLKQNLQGVTKVIINNQPGNNLGQQLRLISAQSLMSTQESSNQTSGAINVNSASNNANNNKVALQFHPVNVGLPNTKIQMSSKHTPELKDVSTLKMPSTFSIKPSSSNIVNINQNEPTESHSQSVMVSTPQKILLKGNIPLSSVRTNVSLKPGQILATTGIKLSNTQATQPVLQPQVQPSQPQPLQVPNKVSYIRLVNPTSVASSASTAPQTIVTKASSIAKSIAPAIEQNVKIKGLSIPANQTNPKQRLIIPLSGSNAQSITNNLSNLQIRPQGSITLPASALPAGVLNNAQPGSLVMIPAHYFQNSNMANPQVIQVSNSATSVSIPNAVTSKVPLLPQPPPPRALIDANGIKPRKPCNCTKSQCLKLYCDCFANGEFCNNCNCANCYNNLAHEEERQKSIKSCLERNPQAFRPKIGKGGTESERRHNKGCNCKRSGCLKNYCECYEAKIPCSSMCRCIGCRNVDNCQPPERKKFYQLIEPADNKSNPKSFVKNRPVTFSSLPSPAKMSLSSNGKSYCKINQEVVEATCQCLLAQAEKAEKSRTTDDTALLVINEFSRCLLQIIGCNTKNSSRIE